MQFSEVRHAKSAGLRSSVRLRTRAFGEEILRPQAREAFRIALTMIVVVKHPALPLEFLFVPGEERFRGSERLDERPCEFSQTCDEERGSYQPVGETQKRHRYGNGYPHCEIENLPP